MKAWKQNKSLQYSTVHLETCTVYQMSPTNYSTYVLVNSTSNDVLVNSTSNDVQELLESVKSVWLSVLYNLVCNADTI